MIKYMANIFYTNFRLLCYKYCLIFYFLKSQFLSIYYFFFTEIEAKEACKWLRAAGFPQYAQMYEGKYVTKDFWFPKIFFFNIY